MWSIQRVDATGSTNADVADAARAGAAEGLAIVADHQQAGRGRLDRLWRTPAGTALTVSFLLRPVDVPARQWPWLPLVTGIAVVDAVVAIDPEIPVGVKWPNDVLVGGDKLAGILLERIETSEGAAAVIGVGLNVSQSRDVSPEDGGLVDAATSLRTAGAYVDRDVVLDAVAARLADRYRQWRSASGDPVAAGLLEEYRRCSVTLGQRVRAVVPSGDDLIGTARDIDATGRLIVATDDGSEMSVGAGDIVHLRPA